jgi:hypothetical protein
MIIKCMHWVTKKGGLVGSVPKKVRSIKRMCLERHPASKSSCLLRKDRFTEGSNQRPEANLAVTRTLFIAAARLANHLLAEQIN